MCGIFGYLGERKDAPEIVIEGLKCLEYRGYDSWGVGIVPKEGEITIKKEVGKIGEIDPKKENFPQSSLAIGHSRWATHGNVTKRNAHPHTSSDEKIVLVHNGICENYLEIKEFLTQKGFTFHSQTDTEVIVKLIEYHNKNHQLEEAVEIAVKELEGRYAIVVLKQDERKIVAARKGSPLIIGINEEKNEYYVASDIPAFLKHTNKVIYLDDNQMVVISGEKNDKPIKFLDILSGEIIQKRIIEIEWKAESVEKGDFPHFMIKEISEQKETIRRAINQDTETIQKLAEAINKADNTYFIGCGTAGKVAMVGEYLFAKIAQKQTRVSFGCEFPHHRNFLNEKSLICCISQSGETADTLEAIEISKERKSKVACIVNVESSTMARVSDIVVPIKAGPEKAVASTKATTSQLAILTLLAYAAANKLSEGEQLLINTVSQINDMLNPRYEEHIMKLAQKIKDVESMYIIGRGMNYPMALEAAIKLQEVSYIHAEGFAGGELKHGPLALIDQNTPVIALVAKDESEKEIISNATEVKARGGYIIGISPEKHEVFDFWIRVPDVGNTSPIVNIIPTQILAYQLAVLLENDPDMPRNLAKSVTVK